jgi:hypothetical protein
MSALLTAAELVMTAFLAAGFVARRAERGGVAMPPLAKFLIVTAAVLLAAVYSGDVAYRVAVSVVGER